MTTKNKNSTPRQRLIESVSRSLAKQELTPSAHIMNEIVEAHCRNDSAIMRYYMQATDRAYDRLVIEILRRKNVIMRGGK